MNRRMIIKTFFIPNNVPMNTIAMPRLLITARIPNIKIFFQSENGYRTASPIIIPKSMINPPFNKLLFTVFMIIYSFDCIIFYIFNLYLCHNSI